ILNRLVGLVRLISELPVCRTVCRKMYRNLTRRVKLLSPLFEELNNIGGIEDALADEVLKGLDSLTIALESAYELLKSVHEGSKIFQALRISNMAAKFESVTQQVEAALSQIPYNRLDLSEEVLEQIELLHAQFKRAVGRTESLDLHLVRYLAMESPDLDSLDLKSLSEKLHLKTIMDIKKESLAIHDMVISCGGVPEDISEEHFAIMSYLLVKLKDIVLLESSHKNSPTEIDKNAVERGSPFIPHEFRCSLSLELMKDPVIVSTGQTYERAYIQRWIDTGRKTCPKTQQPLAHTSLTPNYVLKSIIALWCESNGVELPPKQGKGTSSGSDCDLFSVTSLLQKLERGNAEQRRAAAGEIRLLAKRNDANRIRIAEAGAIPFLVRLLSSSPDPRTREHAVTALLNLSINEAIKGRIVASDALPHIVEVLENGSASARENAAAALYSLSVVDKNKVAIGDAGAVPPLVDLLHNGTSRGKKDAATAIFSLSKYHDNTARAVRAGIVPPLVALAGDPETGMEDEALSILAVLAGHPDGKAAITLAEPIPILAEVIRTGTARCRENAAAVMWCVCAGNPDGIDAAREAGVLEALMELKDGGSDRGKRKAADVLVLLRG
ncbi:hypothetical protein M569_12951, partial [Genlisea aurea]